MRHLLIILTFFLFTFPLFGQSKETGVLFFRYGNEDVGWYEEDDGSKSGKYVGEFKDGLPNGQGTRTYIDGEKYEGELEEWRKEWSRNIHLVYWRRIYWGI